MQIHGDSQKPVDPATRKPQTDAARRVPAQAGQAAQPPATTSDHADVGASPAEIARYVQILKAMNPVDLHKVEDLRARIRDGAYKADADEMAGPLADRISRGNRSSSDKSG